MSALSDVPFRGASDWLIIGRSLCASGNGAVLGVESWPLRIATSRVVRSEEIRSAADPYIVSREGEPPTRPPAGGVDAMRVMRTGNALVSSTCSGCIAPGDLSLALLLPLSRCCF